MFYLPNRTPCPPEHIPGRVISIVGAGGKSTILYCLARHHAARGKRVLVLTTTKIWVPDRAYYAETALRARGLWEEGSFAVIGTALPGLGKLAFPEEGLFRELFLEADLVLIEADGARHYPIKIPRPGEPVLLPQTDTVLCVMGLSALHQPVGRVCFGWGNPEDDRPLTEELAARILTGGYGNCPGKLLYVLNQWDRPELGEGLPELLPNTVRFSHFSPRERAFYQQIARGNPHEQR